MIFNYILILIVLIIIIYCLNIPIKKENYNGNTPTQNNKVLLKTAKSQLQKAKKLLGLK